MTDKMNDKTVNAIKYQCARQRNMKEDAMLTTMAMEKRLVKMVLKHDDEDEAWDFIKQFKTYWLGDSKRLGIVSKIADYTNKKGVTFKAHYTINGKYISKATDDKPIHYQGYFLITKEKFKYEKKPGATKMSDLFVPKE